MGRSPGQGLASPPRSMMNGNRTWLYVAVFILVCLAILWLLGIRVNIG